MKRRLSIIDFTTDAALLGLSLSPAQRTILKSLYGEELSAEELDIFAELAGWQYHGHGFSEATVIAGARAGKDSRLATPIALYETFFGGHEQYLARGEIGTCAVVAQNLPAAQTAYVYIRDAILGSKLLASRLSDEPKRDEIQLGKLRIRIFPASGRSALRGASIFTAVLDEVAFFKGDETGAVDADAEVQAAVRRGMISFPNARIVKISTPYTKSGLLWQDYQSLWGKPHSHAVCFKATSQQMNPTLTEDRLERERVLDAARYRREYLAEFEEGTQAWLPAAYVDGALEPGVYERPPIPGTRYYGAADPSGGASDAFVIAICHVEGEAEKRVVVQDVLRAWQGSRSNTIDLEGVVKEAAGIFRSFGIREITQDAFSGHWTAQAWQRHGLRVVAPEGDRTASYLACEPLFATGALRLLANETLEHELRRLERKVFAGGRVVITHPGGNTQRYHDDHADATCKAAAVAWRATEPKRKPRFAAPISIPARRVSSWANPYAGGVEVNVLPRPSFGGALLLGGDDE